MRWDGCECIFNAILVRRGLFLRGRVRPEDCTRNEDEHRDRVHAHPKEGCPDRRPDIQRGRGHAHTGQGFAEACIRCVEPVQTEIGPACGEASEGGWRVDCHGDGRLRQGGSHVEAEPGRLGRSRSAVWDTIRRQRVNSFQHCSFIAGLRKQFQNSAVTQQLIN